MTGDERRALESELAKCRQELQRYMGVVKFGTAPRRTTVRMTLIRAESTIFHHEGRIAEIESLLTRPD